MKYEWKLAQEILWGAFITALVFSLTAVVASQGVTDWQGWTVALAGGTARAVAGFVLSKLVPSPVS